LKRYIPIIGVAILLFCVSFLSDSSVAEEGASNTVFSVADDYHYDTTLYIGTLDHSYVYSTLSQYQGIYGDFEVTSPASGADKIITFFICNDANFDLWEAGKDASCYLLQESVGSYSYTFRIPYADTYYLVFQNYAIFLTKTVHVNLYIDETPPTIDINLDSGASYSGVKEITATITEARFDIDEVKLYIDDVLMDTENDAYFSYSWQTGEYSNGPHVVKIWASDNVGNTGYVTVTVNTSNGLLGGGPMGVVVPLTIVGFVGIVAVAGYVAFSRRKRSTGLGEAPIETGTLGPAPDTAPLPSSSMVESQNIGFCPHCGTPRQMPGARFCPNCGYQFQS